MNPSIIFASIILPILTVPLRADWGACSIGAASNAAIYLQANSSENTDSTTAFTLSAAGGPLVDKTDAIGFASGPAKLKGDCEIVIQLAKFSNGTQDWATAGVMIRENYGVGSKFFAAGCTRGHGIQSFVRNEESAAVVQQENCIDCSPPTWLKIVRQGNHFTSYKSLDGRIWLEINEDDVPMKKAVWVGVFTTSGGGSPAFDVVFDHVTTREISGE
jgi:hypothetical protein